jgi:vancomycin resistance protein YoaR
MAVSPKVLISSKYAENAQTTQYTATNCRTIIDKFTATNISVLNATLSVNIVPASGSAGSTNRIIDSRSISPGETYSFPGLVGHSLEPSGFISTIASAASALVIRSSGREITS